MNILNNLTNQGSLPIWNLYYTDSIDWKPIYSENGEVIDLLNTEEIIWKKLSITNRSITKDWIKTLPQLSSKIASVKFEILSDHDDNADLTFLNTKLRTFIFTNGYQTWIMGVNGGINVSTNPLMNESFTWEIILTGSCKQLLYDYVKFKVTDQTECFIPDLDWNQLWITPYDKGVDIRWDNETNKVLDIWGIDPIEWINLKPVNLSKIDFKVNQINDGWNQTLSIQMNADEWTFINSNILEAGEWVIVVGNTTGQWILLDNTVLRIQESWGETENIVNWNFANQTPRLKWITEAWARFSLPENPVSVDCCNQFRFTSVVSEDVTLKQIWNCIIGQINLA